REWMETHEKNCSSDVATTASDGPHRPNQQRVDDGDLVERSDIKDNPATAERRTEIYPNLVSAIAASQFRLAPRPGLEPGTCGLTVRPVVARKAAPVNDLDQNGR